MDIVKKYKGPIVYYVITFVILMILILIAQKYPQIKNIDFCVLPSKNDLHRKFVRFCRGRKYWSSPELNLDHQRTYDQEEPDNSDVYACGNCLVTSWNISHYITYFGLGFFFPDVFWECLLVGIIFEFLESRFGCYDVLDVFWNSFGFLSGVLLRRSLG